MPAGARRERFALCDEAGSDLANGLELVRLEAEDRVFTRRLAAVRRAKRRPRTGGSTVVEEPPHVERRTAAGVAVDALR